MGDEVNRCFCIAPAGVSCSLHHGCKQHDHELMGCFPEERNFLAHSRNSVIGRKRSIVGHFCVFVDSHFAIVLRSHIGSHTAFGVQELFEHLEIIEITGCAFLSAFRHHIMFQIFEYILLCRCHRLVALKTLPEGEGNGILIQVEGIRNMGAETAFCPVRVLLTQIILVFFSGATDCFLYIHCTYLPFSNHIIPRFDSAWSLTMRQVR